MSASETEDIILHILRTLVQSRGHPLAEDVLRLQVESRVRPRPLKAVMDECLRSMRDRGLIMSAENELDLTGENPLWLLDEKGQAMAIRMRL